MLKAFKEQGDKMCLNVHFLHSWKTWKPIAKSKGRNFTIILDEERRHQGSGTST